MDLGVNQAYELLSEKLQNWINTAIELVPNIIAALLILLLFFGIGWLIRKVVSRSLNRVTKNKAVVHLLETIAGVIVIAAGAFIALSILQLDGAVTTLLAGAGVVGLALGFAFQDIAANFMSGIMLSIRHPFGLGDIIESNGHFGAVHEINMRCIIIKDPEGQLVYIPNRLVLENPFENYTWNSERRIDLDCGVSYGDDLEKAKKLAIEAVGTLENLIEDRDIELVYKEFGGSSINFEIRFWIHYTKHFKFMTGRSEAIMAIKKKFDENDIMIPFPIRTLDFGIRGGEKLDTMLTERAADSNDSGDE